MVTTPRTGSWDLPCQIIFFHEREREEDSIEDHQSYQPDVDTVFENDDDSNSENVWSDDSESETEI